jgi:hypothetical protein
MAGTAVAITITANTTTANTANLGMALHLLLPFLRIKKKLSHADFRKPYITTKST